MKHLLDEILPSVLKPARYTGGELNEIKKDWDSSDVRVCLSYPDTYEVGMSNLGLQILYHAVNGMEGALAERSYAPWPDMEAKLRENKLPLYSLESFKPLSEFDLIGFSLQHELTYTNLMNMLDLAGIPIHSKDRSANNYPLVFAGGPCAFNPKPVEDFFDFLLIGEGDEAIIDIVEAFRKNKGKPRGAVLEELAGIEGVYVPSLRPEKVKRRIVANLDECPFPTRPVVPYIETIHDRAMVEIMRGCPRSCRFCQARSNFHPVRTRKKETIERLAQEIIGNTGYEEASLISLSSSDHPKIEEIAKDLAAKFSGKKVSISLPSVRMDSFSISLARDIAGMRPPSVTLAPEAGTQRLRDVIGKCLSEEDIIGGARAAFEAGIEKIKLYFMIGLPTETDDDVHGIVELARRIAAAGREVFSELGKKKGRIRITASVSTFIPKPHTPLEREEQIPISETMRKQKLLKENMRDRSIELRWHDPAASFLEGVFSRGDEKLSGVIEAAWRLGARLDAWSEHFKLETWERAFVECGVDPNVYLNRRDERTALPWSFIEI